MDFYDCLCVCLLYVSLHVVASHRSTDCANSDTKSTVKLPSHRQLLSLDDFNRYVVDPSMMAVLYGIIPKQEATTPPEPVPLNSVNLVYTRTSNSLYTLQLTGTTGGVGTECSFQLDFELQTYEDCDKALFQDSTSKFMFWSSCPSEYVIVTVCIDDGSSVKRKDRECPIENVQMYVLLPRNPADGPPDDVPMYEIVKYLKRVTDIKFGSSSFNWAYLFGEASQTPCPEQ